MIIGKTQTIFGKDDLNQLCKLHIGCGRRKIYGYINIDSNKEVCPDVIDNCLYLSAFSPNSVDVIYCCHVLEHFTEKDALLALKRWRELLKPNGILRVSVPDLEALCEYYVIHRNFQSIKKLLYGDQTDQFNFHYTAYDEKTLSQALSEVGFRNIARYNWQSTEHFFIDDYSQCYLPKIGYCSRREGSQMDGKLVSLNIEAIK